MNKSIIVLTIPLLLTSCASINSSGANNLRLVAPNVINYTAIVQEQAAQEVAGNACPVLSDFTKDYYIMRNQSRVIK